MTLVRRSSLWFAPSHPGGAPYRAACRDRERRTSR